MKRARTIGAMAAAAALAGGGACFPTYEFGGGASGDGGVDATLPGSEAGAHEAGRGDDAPSGDDDGPSDGDDGGPSGHDGGDSGHDGGDSGGIVVGPVDGGATVTIEAGTFTFGGGGGVTAQLTRDFAIDTYETTVARFKAFVAAGSPLPCDGGACSLDPGGPYESAMVWDATWNSRVQTASYTGATCSQARGTGVTHATFDDTDTAHPIGCVSWYQAVASCAFEGKRLPTETEWEYVATGRGLARAYPWGSTAPVKCDQAIWFGGGPDDAGDHNGCHWPVDVGSTVNGPSRDGVLDLSGSVFEWVWDSETPGGGANPISASVSNPGSREDRGGSFGSDVGYLSTTTTDSTPPDGNYTDIGFRCARTLP